MSTYKDAFFGRKRPANFSPSRMFLDSIQKLMAPRYQFHCLNRVKARIERPRLGLGV